jgi:hypothetical protein
MGNRYSRYRRQGFAIWSQKSPKPGLHSLGTPDPGKTMRGHIEVMSSDPPDCALHPIGRHALRA